MERTRVLGYLALAALTPAVSACTSAPEDADAPELGSYAGSPLAPAAPKAPGFEVCPPGFTNRGSLLAPSCDPTARPEAPRLQTSCPVGWEYTENAVNPLDPTPVPMCRPRAPSTRCPDTQRVALATGACVAVGASCPPGNSWPPELPSGNAYVYVRAGSSGSGSPSAPYGDFAQALASTPDGGVLVVGPGTYPVSARITRPVTIAGVCAEQVILQGPSSSMLEVPGEPSSVEGALDVHGPGVLTLQNVTVRGQRIGLHVLAGASVTARGVRFDQNTNKAVVVDGGRLELRDAVIERTLPLPDGRKGRGLQVNKGGSATVEDVTFQDNDRTEVAAFDAGTRVSLAGVTLQNTRTTAEADGQALLASDGATLAATRAFVRAKRGDAIYGVNRGELELEHLYVVRTQPDTQGRGLGLNLDHASATLTNAVFFENTVGAIYAGEGSVLTGSDVSVSTTFGASDFTFGRGIAAFDAERVELERVFVHLSNETGVYVHDSVAEISDLTLRSNGSMAIIAEQNAALSVARASSAKDEVIGVIARSGATLTLTDTSIEDVLQDTGRGVNAGYGIIATRANLRLERVTVRRAHQFGVITSGSGTVSVDGLAVEDTLADPADAEEAHGVQFTGGDVTAAGLVVRRAEGAGLVVGDTPSEDNEYGETIPATRFDASDVRVEQTLPMPTSGEFGIAVSFLSGVEGEVKRLSIAQSRSAGLSARHGSEVSVTDLSVRDTQPQKSSGYLGMGVAAQDGARLTLERALVTGSSALGVMTSGSLSSIQAVDLSVLDTKVARGVNGSGIAVLSGAGFELERGRISGAHAAGILAQFAGVVKASDLVIADVAAGTFTNEDIFGREDIQGAGDCVLALSRASVELTRATLAGCARVGMLFDDASGTLADVAIRQAPLGIALQGFPRPELRWSSIGAEGIATPLMAAGSLPVPASSPPILSAASNLGNLVRTP